MCVLQRTYRRPGRGQVPEIIVGEKEDSKPGLPVAGELIRLNCPVCANPSEMLKRDAWKQFQCKQCGMVSKLGILVLEVEVESKPVTPPTTSNRFLCNECEYIFWGKAEEEVRCLHCDTVLTPPALKKMPLKTECRECGRWFPIGPESFTLCKLCWSGAIHPAEPHSSLRTIGNRFVYLFAAILVVMGTMLPRSTFW